MEVEDMEIEDMDAEASCSFSLDYKKLKKFGSWLYRNEAYCLYDYSTDPTTVPTSIYNMFHNYCFGIPKIVNNVYLPSMQQSRNPIGCTWKYAFACTKILKEHKLFYTIYATVLHRGEYDNPLKAIRNERRYETPWKRCPEEMSNVISITTHDKYLCVLFSNKIQVYNVSDWTVFFTVYDTFTVSDSMLVMNSMYIVVYQNNYLHVCKFLKYNKNKEDEGDGEDKKYKNYKKLRIEDEVTALSISTDAHAGNFNLIAIALKNKILPIDPNSDKVNDGKPRNVLGLACAEFLLNAAYFQYHKLLPLRFTVDKIIFNNSDMCVANTVLGISRIYRRNEVSFRLPDLKNGIMSIHILTSSNIALIQDCRSDVFIIDLANCRQICMLDHILLTSGEPCEGIKNFYPSFRVFSDRLMVLMPDCSLSMINLSKDNMF